MHTRGSGQSSNSETSGNVNGKRKTPAGKKSVTRTGKKSKVSSAFSGIHDLQINDETMSFYKAMQAKLRADKKTAAASQEEGKLL
jgi:hypothetical protein